MLTIREVSRILDVSERTVLRWIREGDLPASRSRERYRVNPVDLLEWASARGVELSPEFGQRWAVPELPSLSEALAAGGIHHRVPGHSKDAVLRAVVRKLPLTNEQEQEFVLQGLLAREVLGSTAIGNGIAIPHVRNPIILHVNKPAVTLSFLENAIDFGALDGKPVSVLFTLVSPTVRLHLHLLSRLSYVLHDPELHKLLRESASSSLILERVQHIEGGLHDAERRKRQAESAP
jgi:PTS system nitrogen regulatory IIA component